MICEPLLIFAGVEVANSLRTYSYLRQGLGGPWDVAVANAATAANNPAGLSCYCKSLAPNGETYTSPASDPAPWYDATRPESADFLGLLAQITLLPVTNRILNRKATGGGSIGSLVVQPRMVQVDATIVANTKAGMGYGERWLNTVLAGTLTGCGVDTATILPYCTALPSDSSSVAKASLRDLSPVGLVTAPVFSQPVPFGACHLQDVKFQLAAGSGYLRAVTVLTAAGALGSVKICDSMVSTDISQSAALIEISAGGSILNNVVITGKAGVCPIVGTPDVTYTIQNLPAGAVISIDASDETVTAVDGTGSPIGGFAFLQTTGLVKWLRSGIGQDFCVCVDPSAATGTAGAQLLINKIALEL